MKSKPSVRIAAVLLSVCWNQLLAPVSTRGAEQGTIVSLGSRVRVSAPSAQLQKFKGEVVDVSGRRLTIMHAGQLTTVPFDAITKLDVSRGPCRKTGKGALIGLLVGVGAGALVAVCPRDSSPSTRTPRSGTYGLHFDVGFDFITRKNVFAIAGTLFGAVGAGTGAIIGYTRKGEKWKRVPSKEIQVGVLPVSNPGPGLGVSVRF